MRKEFLNNLSFDEIKERIYKGEKVFNETDETSYAKYVDGLGLCKFQKKSDRLVTINLTLTLFCHLYFEKDNGEDMVGCVGWFWGDYEEEKSLGILTEYRPEIEFHFVKGNNDNVYSHFRPAKKSELKFWEENETK